MVVALSSATGVCHGESFEQMLEEIHEGNGGQKRLEEAQGNNDISIQGENEAEAQVDRGLLTIARHALRDATTTTADCALACA